ncbi:hypothetical protein PPYR_06223 [Photinus pyralis]|uniref:Retrotransposon gag domain-containing protein n=1 Tax=Photinus pyralis TaxID=7054 RepID=A0A5N4ATA1_PHOPY|nr:hypothetical protein PPYR_06223 [Photinus pyralis]
MPDNITIENLSNILQNMSLTTPTIQAAKAIADFLPTFSGDSSQLESFIKRCDTFYNSYGITADTALNNFSFNVLYSKLKDEVLNFVMGRPDLTTWPLIRTALRDHYGDRVDRQTLTREFLHMSIGRNENILDFLDRIGQMKSRLEIKISSESGTSAERKVLLMEQNEGNALGVLLSNVDDKVRLLLEIGNAKNLTEASDIVVRHFYNEQRINSMHHDSRQRPNQLPKFPNKTNTVTKRPFQNSFPFGQSYNNYTPHFDQTQVQRTPYRYEFNPRPNFPNRLYQHEFNPRSKFPSQPVNIQSPPVKQYFPTNSQVFGKPKDVFSPKNSYKPQNKPEPMSTTSRNPSIHHKQQQQYNYFRSDSKPNFISEEIHLAEADNEIYSKSDYNSDQYPCENDSDSRFCIENCDDVSYEYDSETCQNFQQLGLTQIDP